MIVNDAPFDTAEVLPCAEVRPRLLDDERYFGSSFGKVARDVRF